MSTPIIYGSNNAPANAVKDAAGNMTAAPKGGGTGSAPLSAQNQATMNAIKQGGPNQQVTGTPAKMPLLVTSNASRATYAKNVQQMNEAKANLPSGNPSIVDFMSGNNMPSDYNSRAALAKQNGIEGYTGSAAQNTQLLQILQGGNQGTTGSTPAPAVASTPAPAPTTAPTVPATTDTTATDTTTADTTRNAIDPSLRGIYDSSMQQLDQGISDAKQTLSTALSTLQNDPAATNAINMIMSRYDTQINVMKDKNAMLLASMTTNSIRGGSMQYANEMQSNFMSAEQDKASQRIADIVTTEAQMVMKTQEAYKNGDVKAFSAASDALKTAQSEKTKAINDLLTKTNAIVKEQQAQVKIEQAAAKQKITDDIRVSATLGATMAQAVKDSGITDPARIQQYVEGMASKSGITNVDILNSAFLKAQQDNAKTDLAAENTKNTMADRNARLAIAQKKANAPAKAKVTKSTGGGKDGAYVYTGEDVSAYAKLLNEGGTDATGNTLGARGSDKFTNTGTYVAALNDWVANGGSTGGFAKKFPVKDNVNPADYESIPQGIRPKVTDSRAL